jgi:hypothetical protein
MDWNVWVRQSRHGAFRISKVGQGKAGMARSGLARTGRARQAFLNKGDLYE